ncbi:MAG: Ni/Fe-hydrogenase cytochrome b subunit [Rhodospirillales bacterium]|nr:Ni/Fe-hydrogenase cytochrome b subunit [Rhodospirillales bacterium]
MMKAQPIGGRVVTPVTLLLGLLVAIALYLLGKRFLLGLGAVTNINDGFPWGLWIAWDVVIGTALACGGYAMALLVYVANKGHYHPLVRPALLASVFGYSLGGLSVIFDLGRWWNAWHIFAPAYIQWGSVMVEVALCIAAYVVVLWIEFLPTLFERLGMTDARAKLDKALFVIIALGILLPTMHQSSLGSLLVVFGYQIHPLWQSNQLLPLLFLISAIGMGFSVVVFEACLSSVGFQRPLEVPILERLAGILVWLLVAFLVLRFLDLAVRGAVGAMFASGALSFWFWLETVLFALPVVLLFKPQARARRQALFLAATAMLLAGALYRINAFLIGYETGPGWHYFPALSEVLVTVGIVALEILAYIVFVRKLPVLPRAH